MTLDSDKPGFVIVADNLWKGERLFDLYMRAATPYEWFPELFKIAREEGIIPFCSPFDERAVEMLEALDAPAYKIASFELVDVELIARAARSGRPLIISTGMGVESEIADALAAARAVGAKEIALLKCTSSYPADPGESNLATIPTMAQRFDVPVGLSDHTLGINVPVAACAIGACIVEKHFIDAREPVTADSVFSALPDELAAMVKGCREAAVARGNVFYGPMPHESESLAFRRSLYAVRDIAEGEAITRENVRSIRPGFGLPVKELRGILGRPAKVAIARGTPMSWDLIV
jgi:N-acetylneuraminate synthase